MQTVMCAAVGRHSKTSAWVRSMYCVWRPYCVQLWAQQVISMGQKHLLCMETVLCAAVGTTSWLEACNVYGVRTVCSCRQAQQDISMWARSIYRVWQSCTEPIYTKLTGKFLKSFI